MPWALEDLKSALAGFPSKFTLTLWTWHAVAAANFSIFGAILGNVALLAIYVSIMCVLCAVCSVGRNGFLELNSTQLESKLIVDIFNSTQLKSIMEIFESTQLK